MLTSGRSLDLKSIELLDAVKNPANDGDGHAIAERAVA